jgi:hypothetical protein
MFTLRAVPETTQAGFWEYGSDDQSIYFIRWPADVGSERVDVKVSALALNFGIDTAKAKAALERHRHLIERMAQSKYRPDDKVVTLDVADFRNVGLKA